MARCAARTIVGFAAEDCGLWAGMRKTAEEAAEKVVKGEKRIPGG